MSPNQARYFTDEQIVASTQELLREKPEYAAFPLQALRQAAINRLNARRSTPPPASPPAAEGASTSSPREEGPLPCLPPAPVQMLKSKGVIEVKEEIESKQCAAVAAADPDRMPGHEKPSAVQPPDTTLKEPAYVQGAAEYVLDATDRGRIPDFQITFQFVRILKAHPTICELPTRTAWELTRRHAVAFGGGSDPEDAEAEFFDAWDSVRLPAGVNPLDEALRRARQTPLGLFQGGKERPNGYKLFISLAGWLCVVIGSDRIKLPCEAVAAVLGVTPMTISRYRKFAIVDGYLIKLMNNQLKVCGDDVATTFRFKVECWKILQEAMPAD